MRTYAMERARDRIAALTQEGVDLATLWREASAVIEPVISHYGGACWYTLDPVSLLITRRCPNTRLVDGRFLRDPKRDEPRRH